MAGGAAPAGGAVGRAPRALAWGVVCFLLLPILVVVPVSLTDRPYLSLPAHRLSLAHYAQVLASPAWLSAIGQSLLVATLSMLLALAAGTACAVGCWRLGTRGAELVRLLLLVPLVVPAIVYAVGLYRLWAALHLLDTHLGVVLAHAVTAVPYVVIIVSTALAGFDPRLEQASRSLGAGLFLTLWRVLLPNLRPALVSAGVFAFIHSWDELVLVLFVAGRGVLTLPRRMWDGINDDLDPSIAAVAVLLMLLTLLLLGVERLLRGRAASRPPDE